MNLIDFHVHIDYYENFHQIYDYYSNNRIYTLAVTNLPETYEKCIKSFKKSQYVKSALGYNPQFVGVERFNKRKFDQYFHTTKYIGEVGLDFSKGYANNKSEQLDVFDYIVSRCGKHNKIMSIHSRNAEDDVVRILKDHQVKFAVFHWYTGKIEKIGEIVDMGYYFSANIKMLESRKGLSIIKNIPLDRLLIETDGPFIDFKKQKITPDKLAEVYTLFKRALHVNDLEQVVFTNLKRLLLEQYKYIS